MTEGIEHYLTILDELNTILPSEDEEFVKLKEAKRLVTQLQDTRKEQLEAVKTCIAEFTAEVEERQGRGELGERQVEEEGRCGQVKQELEQQLSRKQAVQQQVQDLEKELKTCEEEKENLENERERIENSTTKVLPAKRHDVNLFQHVSGIRWQYDTPAHLVKGLMSSRKKVETFELDSQQNSQFFIANHLWDLIESTKHA